MKEIKILHLFPRLLSLYGEYGNVAVLKAALVEKGCSVTVTESEDGNADFGAYDFVYIGSGTEDNLMVALERLLHHRDAIAASVQSKTWLATGNAMTLFGKTVTRGDSQAAGLDVFGYDTVIDDSKRYLGDVLTEDKPQTLGFINNACRFTGIESPLQTLYLNKQLGNDKATPAEGIREGNFFGTQFIGPYLVKNPHCLAQIIGLLTGEDYTPAPGSYGVKAYHVALSELRKRAGLTD